MSSRQMTYIEALDMIIRPLYTFSVSHLKTLGIIENIELYDETDNSMPYFNVLEKNNVAKHISQIHACELGYEFNLEAIPVYVTFPFIKKRDFEMFKRKSGIDVLDKIKDINNEILNNPEQCSLLGFEDRISIVYYEIRIYKAGEYYGTFWTVNNIPHSWGFNDFLVNDDDYSDYRAEIKLHVTTDMNKLRRLIYRSGPDIDMITEMIKDFKMENNF